MAMKIKMFIKPPLLPNNEEAQEPRGPIVVRLPIVVTGRHVNVAAVTVPHFPIVLSKHVARHAAFWEFFWQIPGVGLTLAIERQHGVHAAEIAAQLGLQESKQSAILNPPVYLSEKANFQIMNPKIKSMMKNPKDVGAIEEFFTLGPATGV
jgi:hypothetical protein